MTGRLNTPSLPRDHAGLTRRVEDIERRVRAKQTDPNKGRADSRHASVEVYRTTAQSIPDAVSTAVVFQAARHDDFGMWNGGSGLVCKVAGTYVVAFNCHFAPATAVNRVAILKLNGVPIADAHDTNDGTAGGTHTGLSVTALPKLLVGDIVTAEVLQQQAAGAALDLQAQTRNSPTLSMALVGNGVMTGPPGDSGGSSVELCIDDLVAGGADNTAALAAHCTAANALAATLGTRAILKICQMGRFGITKNFIVPERVGIEGLGEQVTWLYNLSTTGENLLVSRGSGVSFRHIGLDGMKAAQTIITTGATLEVTKPAGLTGGGQTVSGGLLLSSAVAIGATSIVVTTATMSGVPVLAGDEIMLYDPGAVQNAEVVRVAHTYTGGTTIPLTSATLNAYATSSYVTVYATDVDVENVNIRALGFMGIDLWHALGSRVDRVRIRDATDTAIGVAAGGTRHSNVTNCDIEGNSSWGIFIDSGDIPATGGLAGRMTIAHNHVRLLPGANPTYECIGLASGGAVSYCDVAHNHLDIERAGLAGISLRGDLNFGCGLIGNSIYCGGRAGTSGVVRYGASATPFSQQAHSMRIALNLVVGPAGPAFNMGDIPRATFVDNEVRGGLSDAVRLVPNNDFAQEIVSIGNYWNTALNGFTDVGTAPTHNLILRSIGDRFEGQAVAPNGPFALRAGWVVMGDQRPQTFSGAGVPGGGVHHFGAKVADLYVRTDTPGVALQNIYICTVAGWPGTWVAIA